MEKQNNSFIHDTINLDEIRRLLENTGAPVAPAEPKPVNRSLPEKQEAVLEDVQLEEAEITEEEQREPKSFAYELYGMLHDLVYILAFVTLLFVFVVRLVGVDGTSMLPTLHHGDFLLLESNFIYDADDIEYGDIVVLNVPYYWERDRSLIVKRVIATEGQTVDIDFSTGDVYVDGVCLQEDYILEKIRYDGGEYALEYPVTVPEGHIFVLGDNRNGSADSRLSYVGMIDERCVLGKAWAIAMPGQTKDIFGNVTDPREWGRIGLVS